MPGTRYGRCRISGGDRFAGNLVCLPHGLYYGHQTPETVAGTIDAYRRGEVILEGYRGRSTWDFTAQAAEYLLRERTGRRDLDAFQLLSLTPFGPRPDGPGRYEDVWEAHFIGRDPDQVHVVRFERRRGELRAYLTCLLNEGDIPQYYPL